MSEEVLQYERMVENALRGVVRETLEQVAEVGLPGDHHLYITFSTDYPGVDIPEYLIRKYPEEMTIVLQYKFWGLKIEDDLFKVTLSFNKVSERLTIPFEAITGFADPTANFGLRFESSDEAYMDDETLFSEEDYDEDETEEALPKASKKASVNKSKKTAEIITLDSFRNKP